MGHVNVNNIKTSIQIVRFRLYIILVSGYLGGRWGGCLDMLLLSRVS